METEVSPTGGFQLSSYPGSPSSDRSHLTYYEEELTGSFQLVSMSGQIKKLNYDSMTSVGWVVSQIPVDGKKVLKEFHFNGNRTNTLDVIELNLFFRELPLEHAGIKLFDVFDGIDNDAEKDITWVRVNAPRLGQDLPAGWATVLPSTAN
jgi:hypothetical protein